MIELALDRLHRLWNAFFVAAEYAFVTVRGTRPKELIDPGPRAGADGLSIVDRPAVVHLRHPARDHALVPRPRLGRRAGVLPPRGTPARPHRRVSAKASPLRLSVVWRSPLSPRCTRCSARSCRRRSCCRTASGSPGTAGAAADLHPPASSCSSAFLDGWPARRRARSALREPGPNTLAHSEEELSGPGGGRGTRARSRPRSRRWSNKAFAAPTRGRPGMVPRPDVVGLPVTLTPVAAMEEVLWAPFTRDPCTATTSTTSSGPLHIRRLYDALDNGGRELPSIESLIRPAIIDPEMKPLAQAAPGDVADEHATRRPWSTNTARRRASPRSRPCSRRSWARTTTSSTGPTSPSCGLSRTCVRVVGSFPIDEFYERFGCELSDEDYIRRRLRVRRAGRAPVQGDVVETAGRGSRCTRWTARASSRSTSRSSRGRSPEGEPAAARRAPTLMPRTAPPRARDAPATKRPPRP